MEALISYFDVTMMSNRRTLNDLYSPYFSPEVMVKFTRRVTGHYVTLIENGM